MIVYKLSKIVICFFLSLFLNNTIAASMDILSIGSGSNGVKSGLTAYLSTNDINKVINWINDSVAAAKTPFCYKTSYGRGVGVPVSACRSDQVKDGALCYSKCRDGYTSDGAAICYENCRDGYSTSTVGMCHYTGGGTTYTKSCHYNPISCHTDKISCHGFPVKCSGGGTHCSGGDTTCDGCRDGYHDDGLICRYTGAWDYAKGSYGRGAGSPMTCQSNQQMDASLCYTPCRDGFGGVGPVCWQNCPTGTKACGAGCAASTAACADTTSSMVIAPLTMAASIFTFGTAGAALGPATAALRAGIEATDVARMSAETAGRLAGATNDLAEKYAAHFDEAVTPTVVSTLHANFGPQGYKMIAEQYGLTLAAVSSETIASYLRSVAILDPTGVSGTIAAFAQPQCTKAPSFPSITVLRKD